MIIQYMISGMAGKRKWSQQFKNKIYFKSWDMSVAILNSLTQIYDFSAEGWYNIVAYSYQLAKTQGAIMKNDKYLCYDTGLCTASFDRIYLLAEKNYRMDPEWVLIGITTLKSKKLSEIIKNEFGNQI